MTLETKPMFEEVPPQPSYKEVEARVLEFWKEKDVFKRSEAKDGPNFVFYEGPPTANGQPAMHHVHLVPMAVVYPAEDLAAAERTDRGHECRAANLFAQCQRLWLVELFGAMHREAEVRPAQTVRKHRHLRAVRAEVGVNMLHLPLPQPLQEQTGFGEINQVMRQ